VADATDLHERAAAAGRVASGSDQTADDGGLNLLERPDGRRLAYAEFGAADGFPVLYCHGFPSSRREALLLHASAVANSARIIAADRPGYGDSDDVPGRDLLDWADDLLALANHLGLERFALLGVSGGGPYAVAAAWRLPRQAPGRLAGAALICPLGPIYQARLLHQMSPAVRTSLGVARATPWLVDLIYGGVTAAVLERCPGLVEEVRSMAAPPVDRAVLASGDTAAILNQTVIDAMRQGAVGPRRDLLIYTQDWCLPFAEISQPLQIWHGDQDGTVPIEHARWYADHLPAARLTELPGEGHYSVPLCHTDRILAALLADCR